jgi:hypothetical protein
MLFLKEKEQVNNDVYMNMHVSFVGFLWCILMKT